MVESKIDEKARSVYLKAKSRREFFLIHGYTGSPSDFNELGAYLHKRFNANVKIIRLKGHGTKIEELGELDYEDFLKQAEIELKKDLDKGLEIVVGGYSFGAQLALNLAAKYHIRGVFTVSIPHKLRFPLNLPFLGILGLFKKKWKKRLWEIEIKLREKSFYYKEMHAKGLEVVKKGKQETKKSLENISVPLLTIHSKDEYIGHYNSVEYIERRVKSRIKKSFILESPYHNLFYSEDNEEIMMIIGDFFEENNVFGQNKSKNLLGKRKNIAAIVPSYNEAFRIQDVLKVLTKTKMLDEIIVVDDSSQDDTEKVVRKFKNVKYIRNKRNMGKGYSMDVGVKNTKAEIIFFCDADLIALTPEIIEDTIRPVLNEEVDMFIAVRGNIMQRVVLLFGLNSGERALRRDVWENLPRFYKHRFRIEAGLNYYVEKYGKGLGYRIFSHSQPIKESKYGFFRGTFLRWWMNFDVAIAYLSCFFMGFHLRRMRKD